MPREHSNTEIETQKLLFMYYEGKNCFHPIKMLNIIQYRSSLSRPFASDVKPKGYLETQLHPKLIYR